MKSWKTSVCGGLGLIFTGLAAVVPANYVSFCLTAAGFLNGLGLSFARDANVSSEQQGIK